MTDNIPTIPIDMMDDIKCGCSDIITHDSDSFRFVNKSDCNLIWGIAWLPNLESWDVFWKRIQKRVREKYRWTERKGYYCEMVNIADHIQEMYEINFSKPIRQGIPMKKGYDLSVEELRKCYSNPPQTCLYHWYRWFGVFTKERKMVAYILFTRRGQFTVYSMILGHGDYLKDEIMFFLHFYIQKLIRESKEECYKGILGTAYYAWISGKGDTVAATHMSGLQFWKSKAGFAPYHLQQKIKEPEPEKKVEKKPENKLEKRQGPHP